MSKYIDADALIKKYQEHHDFFLSAWGGDFKSMGVGDKARCDELTNCIATIVNAPSIELVRCKDCIDNDINLSGTENWCLHFGYDVEDDGFCNYGERVDEPNYYDPALHE